MNSIRWAVAVLAMALPLASCGDEVAVMTASCVRPPENPAPDVGVFLVSPSNMLSSEATEVVLEASIPTAVGGIWRLDTWNGMEWHRTHWAAYSTAVGGREGTLSAYGREGMKVPASLVGVGPGEQFVVPVEELDAGWYRLNTGPSSVEFAIEC